MSDKKSILPFVLISHIWQASGMGTIVYLAAIVGIDQEMYEAAMIDGAGRWKQLWHITLPMMASSITINVITTTIAGFKAYELPYLISKGLPNKTTLLMTQRIFFFGFQDYDYGMGSALAVFLMLIIAAISLIQLIYLRKREEVY
jgi:ABC-type sugar transport system permease subunit